MDICDSIPYIDDDKLSAAAASSARLITELEEGSFRAYLRLSQAALSQVRSTHTILTRRYGDKAEVPAAYEWLLDNMYMVLREYRSAAVELQSAKGLRLTNSAPLIASLCRSLLLSGRGKLSKKRIKLFLEGFQSVIVLRREELRLLPAVLRLEIISSLADVCRNMQYSADSEEFIEPLEALFCSLRLLSGLDLTALLRQADFTDAVFRRDPTGEYPRMDEKTREEYLYRASLFADRAGLESHIYAEKLLALAAKEQKHIGFYLFPDRADFSGLYIAANLLLSLFISLYFGFMVQSIAAALLLLLPVSELVKAFIDLLLLHTVRARFVPRMETENGVDIHGRTICVFSALIDSAETAKKHARALERLYFACRSEGEALSFGILCDLPAADSMEADGDREILSLLETEINTLNRRYGSRFYLFTRPRSFDGERYTAHERKRGAILELARLLVGDSSKIQVCGEKDALFGTRYILTLDSDTVVRPGSVGELIGAALHPLNRAVIDKKNAVVTHGHAIFHPKMSTELGSAHASDFSIIFGGRGGIDPYSAAVSEVCMDCFSSGGFFGKGLIDAKALLLCTQAHIPDGKVLSHDALEGAFLRGAYLSDTEFADSFPSDALSYYKRLHRWIRGDWQNLPWLFKAGRMLRPIEKYRLFENLRRSLVSPLTFAAIAAGLLLPSSGTQLAALAALISLLRDILLSALEGSRARYDRPRLRSASKLLTGIGGSIVRSFFRLWLLPYEAYVSLSAIFTSLWRMCISRKKLLQWQTAAQSGMKKASLSAHIKAFLPIIFIGLGFMLLSPLVLGKSAGLMWLLSPLAAYALALPAYKETTLSSADREYIVKAAADTWKYLTEYSNEKNNFLPPDNYQEQPPVGTAYRTSPTNIGFAMVSAVAVYDMGIIDKTACINYVNKIMSTIERMPSSMGHLFNWYDTKTLKPLSPAFISTVDSGNLCASLYTVSEAVREMGAMELSDRLKRFADDMDFSPLFDFERQLFHICYDCEKQCGVGGRYDLMASEARLTSFVAIAKGDVPAKHWQRLSRAQLRCDNYRGLASWTGTMFEYLMPELFLPLYRGSLLFETSRFCIYAQRRSVFAGKPWGMSESGYFSLDAAMSYRYKANGAAALALKRGQSSDCVVSPYSAFLALCVTPRNAVRDLQRMESVGARGEYGFYEAIDYTPTRCRSEDGEKVCSYMAHHAGMSIISSANCVCSGSIIRRFMQNPAMWAYELLLQEQVPDDASVIRRDSLDVPERAERLRSGRWERSGESGENTALILSNGVYSLRLLTDFSCRSYYGDIELYRSAALLGGAESFLFSESDAVLRAVEDGVSIIDRLRVLGSVCGEEHEIELSADRNMSFILTLRLKLILCKTADFDAHPAFRELGIVREIRENALSLRRLGRDGMCDLFALIDCSEKAEFLPDCIKIPLRLRAGEKKSLSLTIRVSFDRDELKKESYGSGNMLSASAAHLGMGDGDIDRAMSCLSALIKNELSGAAAKRRLWQYGVSGDLPIILCRGGAKETVPLIKAQILLRSCGFESDLVIISEEEGEYFGKLRRAVSSLLAHLSLEALLGARGGVHLLPTESEELIASRAAVCTGRKNEALPALPLLPLPAERTESLPRYSQVGDEFRFELSSLPARPWAQILTNSRFSCITAEDGSGYMFMENAREMPISRGTERIFLKRDEHCESLFASNSLPCRVSYFPGGAVWEKQLFGRRVRMSSFVPIDYNARIIIIEGAEGLELEWLLPLKLGGSEICVKCSAEDGIFSAESDEGWFPGLKFYATASAKHEIFPLRAGMQLKCRCNKRTVLVCGLDNINSLTELCKVNAALDAMARTKRHWAHICDAFKLKSGNTAADNYLSRWALYQVIASRLYARAGYYQPGGAYGFRDQLQDAENLLVINSVFLSQRISDCCRHQYLEGDVMHWWHPHPEGDRGLRTRCSDDLLWLCRALCVYVETTGDSSLCFKTEPFITSAPLSFTERDRFESCESTEPVYILDHARAALDMSIKRGFGPHGLPFIGSGDWNDGFDEVGGESVWLGWFMLDTAERFAALLDSLSLPGSEKYRAVAVKLRAACESSWNGAWYSRAYYPDGLAIGGLDRIDSLPQSWAALCGGDGERVNAALTAAMTRLVDDRHNIVKLFTPPFSADERRPGYITAYGEGIRENGGQYTHAAVWLAAALFLTGRHEEGWHILKMLLPENHDNAVYRAEPFVIAADVSAAPGHEGEAGWSWYTGSAGWYFRVFTEYMLGIKRERGVLSVKPRLPQEIKEFELFLRCDGQGYKIRFADGTASVEKIEE